MKTSSWIYYNGNYVEAKGLIYLKWKLKNWFRKYKLINTYKYRLIPLDDMKKIFKLSDKEYEDAEKLYKEKGTISYEFYPCAGIGWGVRIHVLKTDEIIDISDVSTW